MTLLHRSLAVAAVAIASIGLVAGVALAQSGGLEGRFRTGSNVTVGADETIPDDLYASGSQVSIAGRVEGDVVAAGGEVEVTGPVEGDLLVAAGNVTISGEVAGDVRAAGGEVRLEGPVAEDVLIAGGQMTLERGSSISGDVLFTGGQMAIDGRVEGDVRGRTGRYRNDGVVGGEEHVTTTRPEEHEPTFADRVLDVLRRYVSVVIVGALLLWLVPRLMQGASRAVVERPLPALGIGALGLLGSILGFIAIVLATVLLSLLLALIGLGDLVAIVVLFAIVAIIVLVFVVVVTIAFAAEALVGLVAGRTVTRARSDGRGLQDMASLGIGAAIVVVVTAAPGIGGLLKFLVICLGLGGALVALWARRGRAEPA